MLDVDSDPPGKGTILGGKAVAHCKVQGYSALSCAKTAEPIKMSFGIWTRAGTRKHVTGRQISVMR